MTSEVHPPRRIGPFRSGAGFRDAPQRARDEAFARHHRWIRPGHLLLGVALTPDARVDAMLAALHVDRSRLVELSATMLGPSLPPHGGGPDLPYSPHAIQTLLRATRLAERLGWGWLGSAHLLAALADEDWGSVPRVLAKLSVSPAAVHAAFMSRAHAIPPAPLDEPPIYWWDSRTNED